MYNQPDKIYNNLSLFCSKPVNACVLTHEYSFEITNDTPCRTLEYSYIKLEYTYRKKTHLRLIKVISSDKTSASKGLGKNKKRGMNLQKR